MKKIIFNILILSFGIFGISLAANFDAISSEDFKVKIGEENTVVIDIRTPQETALGKITKDVLEIDYYKKDFKNELNKLNKDKTYLIYCAHGNRTRDAKKIMKELNFKSVFDLKGGVVTWVDELEDGPDRKNIVKKYLGKPTVILIAGTFCPHCQEGMPEIKKEIFDTVGDQINLVVNVTDGESGNRFKIDIPQVSNPLLDFEILTGDACAYVPSWVILDKDGVVTEKSCGNRKGIEGIISALKIMDIDFNKKKVNNDKKKKDTNILYLILGLLVVVGGGYWVFKN